MLTGYGNIPTAVAAIKEGAIDYLSKPADADDVERALRYFKLRVYKKELNQLS